MPGPAPNATKPHSRHGSKNTPRGVVMLPAAGCDLPVPPMPRPREWSKEERRLWRELWHSPQATQWDDSFAPAVAAYVCHVTAVLGNEASAWQAQEMRHLGDRLGLTPQGMASLGWVLEPSAAAAPVMPLRSAR